MPWHGSTPKEALQPAAPPTPAGRPRRWARTPMVAGATTLVGSALGAVAAHLLGW